MINKINATKDFRGVSIIATLERQLIIVQKHVIRHIGH